MRYGNPPLFNQCAEDGHCQSALAFISESPVKLQAATIDYHTLQTRTQLAIWYKRKSITFVIREAWVHPSLLLLTHHEMLGKLFKSPKPQFPHLSRENNSSFRGKERHWEDTEYARHGKPIPISLKLLIVFLFLYFFFF